MLLMLLLDKAFYRKLGKHKNVKIKFHLNIKKNALFGNSVVSKIKERNMQCKACFASGAKKKTKQDEPRTLNITLYLREPELIVITPRKSL